METAAMVHRVLLDLEEPVPSELSVASDIVLRVKTSCACGCDLNGRLIMLMNGDETIVASVHDEFAVNVPKTLGTYSWTVLFPRQEVAGVFHERASMAVSFTTRPVPTSLAVWDVPSPVVAGQRLEVKVGAKSSVSSPLNSAVVECLDEAGNVTGRGQLGDTPWEGTTGLYWTEVELVAPASEGIVCWTARFAGGATDLAHGEGCAQFSFAVVRRPDHRVTIRIVEQETDKPIENAYIRLGPFRSMTNAFGVAELSTPKGTYEMTVWHADYETPPMVVEVNEDATLQLTGVAVPQEDPSARFMM